MVVRLPAIIMALQLMAINAITINGYQALVSTSSKNFQVVYTASSQNIFALLYLLRMVKTQEQKIPHIRDYILLRSRKRR